VARRILGSTVIGGMIAASAIAIFLIPVMFYVVEKMASRKRCPAAPQSQSDGSGTPRKEWQPSLGSTVPV